MDDIADSLNMSRSNFYRKIKGVLDLSPNEYLRLERLKKAAQLLKEGEGRVTEICYMIQLSVLFCQMFSEAVWSVAEGLCGLNNQLALIRKLK